MDGESGAPPLEGLLISGLAINHDELLTMKPVSDG